MDLDEKEQNHVRTAMRVLALRLGGSIVLAKAVRLQRNTTNKIARGARIVTPTLAFRVARLAGVTLDDLLAGRVVPQGACRFCGRAPDFADDPTVVEDRPCPAPGGLKVVK